MNRIALLSCVLLVLAGCKRPESAPATTSTAPSAPTASVQAPAVAPAPEVAAEAAPKTAVYPALKVKTTSGALYDLADHRGKWVVVNFWATWCTPCRKEMPDLSALDAMREHIDVIGLAYEDIEPAAMAAFLKAHPVVYPIAIVDVYAPPADFATPRGLPMTYLIAPDGKVARQFLGPVTAREIDAAIAAAGGPKAA
jgi:thiol-disulfide isomerase/thioredoxin